MEKVRDWKSNESDPDPDNGVDLYVISPMPGEVDERDPSVRNEPLEDIRLMLVADDPSQLTSLQRIDNTSKRPSVLFVNPKEKREFPLPRINTSTKIGAELKKLFESDMEYREFMEANREELVDMDEMDLNENAALAKKWNEDVHVNEYGVVEMKRAKRVKPSISIPIEPERRITRSMKL